MPVCYELRISPSSALKPWIVETLYDLGESTFVEGEMTCDLEFDYDNLGAVLDTFEDGSKDSSVILYSEDLNRLEIVKTALLERATASNVVLSENALALRPIANQDWRESWKQSFQPLEIGTDTCVLPPWVDPTEFKQRVRIVIDPGMAFGTGQHETTRLCLLALEKISISPATRVFDVGTGSGILAIAARMRGAGEVLGCDVEEDSVRISLENAEQNGVPECRFTSTPLHEIQDKNFDLVFANIQDKPLRRIFPDIVARTREGGQILISGILESEREDFEAFITSEGVLVDKREKLNDWCAILCHRARS